MKADIQKMIKEEYDMLNQEENMDLPGADLKAKDKLKRTVLHKCCLE
jgi:hypothetical protein